MDPDFTEAINVACVVSEVISVEVTDASSLLDVVLE